MVITNKEKNILKDAMSKAKLYQKKEITEGKEIMPIMNTVRLFLKQKRVLCYGGTAINAALNPEDKFYDAELDIPDYDFFSTNALNDAKQLADIFAKTNKYTIEAKSGQHYGTYKVFVNFIPVADITQCDPFIFERLWEEKLIKQGINYVPPNFLRWSMYLELSRPMGDTSRWEKVYERLDLLNKQYPLPKNACSNPKIKRDQYELHKDLSFLLHLDNSDKLFLDLKRILVKENVIFFGYNAFSEYVSAAKGVDSNIRKNIKNDVIDFEVISLDAAASASTIHRQLIKLGYKNVAVKDSTNPAISDYIEKCYEIVMNDIVLVHIYQSMACHSYHSIQDKKLRMQIKIASIETLFSFYFIFLYLNDHYVRSYRILCVAHTLMMIQAKHKYETNGLLKRFPIECDGKQPMIRDIMNKKYEMFQYMQKNKYKKGDPYYDKWFLNYRPTADLSLIHVKKNKTVQKGKRTKTKRKRTMKKRKRTVPKTKRTKSKKGLSKSPMLSQTGVKSKKNTKRI